MNKTNNTKFTEERVNEIFSVPETKRLLDSLLEKEEERIVNFTSKMTKILGKDENDAKRCIEGVIKKRICTLAEENCQDIKETIHEQLQKPTIIDQIAVEFEISCYNKDINNHLRKLKTSVDKLKGHVEELDEKLEVVNNIIKNSIRSKSA